MSSNTELYSDRKNTGFFKQECKLCGHVTWHTKWGNEDPSCCDHCNWEPGKKRAMPNTMILMDLSKKHEGLSPTELKNINRLPREVHRYADTSKTAAVTVKSAYSDIFDESDLEDALEAATRDPDKEYCHFCGDPIDKIHATTEKKPKISVTTKYYRDPDTKEISSHRQVQVQSETIHACKDCCLKIQKPIIIQRI